MINRNLNGLATAATTLADWAWGCLALAGYVVAYAAMVCLSFYATFYLPYLALSWLGVIR